MFFKSKLKANGVLGMNRRLGEMILPNNPRHLYPSVDCKIKSARLAKLANVKTPEHYFEIESYGDLKHLERKLKKIPVESFVIKPARGAKGNGVLIVERILWDDSGKKPPEFLTTRQNKMSLKQFKHYLSDILSGLYSLNGNPDKIIVQQYLNIHPFFEQISYKGIPDIRVIVYKSKPVMAMLRLPTKASGGRANLHQGAVGCGVRISDGQINNTILHNMPIERHPDTNINLNGKTVPMWDEIKKLASKCYEIVPLGYMGVDIILDPIEGPILLEMNARPGLSIQIANNKGLLDAIRKVDQDEKRSP